MIARMLTARELADLLRLDEKTVRRRTRRGEIPAVNVGTENRPSWRYDQRRIEAWLKRQAA